MKKAIRTTDASLNYVQEMAKAELLIMGVNHDGKLLSALVDFLTQFLKGKCEKVVIVPISNGKFALKFDDVMRADITMTPSGVVKCNTERMGEILGLRLEEAVEAHNMMLFYYCMLNEGLNPDDETHRVEVDKVRRTWNPYSEVVEKTIVLEGTIEQIFDEFTTINDRLKYCNDDWYEWHNESMSKLYRIFIDKYKGNFFLDNAVRRGVIID